MGVESDNLFGRCFPLCYVDHVVRATLENAAVVLRLATRFGVPVTILPDNGPSFVGAGGRKKSARVQHRPRSRASC